MRALPRRLSATVLGYVQDLVVQGRRLVVLVHRVDGRNKHRWFRDILGLDEPQWHRAGANQVPVRIGQQRTRDRRVVMRILDDKVRSPTRWPGEQCLRKAGDPTGHLS